MPVPVVGRLRWMSCGVVCRVCRWTWFPAATAILLLWAAWLPQCCCTYRWALGACWGCYNWLDNVKRVEGLYLVKQRAFQWLYRTAPNWISLAPYGTLFWVFTHIYIYINISRKVGESILKAYFVNLIIHFSWSSTWSGKFQAFCVCTLGWWLMGNQSFWEHCFGVQNRPRLW